MKKLFLFENAKNKVMRIGLNVTVYSFALVFVFMILAVLQLPVVGFCLYFCFAAICAGIILCVIGCFTSKKTLDTSMHDYQGHLTRTIYTYGLKIPGELYEEVTIKSIDGEWYYSTASMTDRFNSGGDRGKVPNEFIINGRVNTGELLHFIAKTYSYMTSMDEYR